MKALITGASSGIGKDMAIKLADMGYDLILVARRKDRLEELKSQIKTNSQVIALDVSTTYNCMKLYEKVKDENVEILINNAGFGVFGNFYKTDLDKELELIDTNIKAVHVLTKLFLKDFKKNNRGYILNVSSSAAFLSGPLMASYYASKGYVLKLTEAIYEELRREKSNVYVGCLCPGPVKTEFNIVAKVKFTIKSLKSKYVAEYAIEKMFNKKVIIIPGFVMRISIILSKFLPRKLLLKITYNLQKKKEV